MPIAELIAPATYRLTRLLRGQMGTDHAIGAASPGNRVMLLDGRVAQVPVSAAWLDTSVELRSFAGPSDAEGEVSTALIDLDAILPLAPVHLQRDAQFRQQRRVADLGATQPRRQRQLGAGRCAARAHA